MTRKRQIIIWAGLWCFWVAVSRNNHPTLLLDCLATGLLVAAFASAVYFNWRVLVPRFWNRRLLGAYWACLLVEVGLLAAGDAFVISKVYDLVWGPDPRRFGFWVNCGLESVGISVHLLAASGMVWLIRYRRRKNTADALRD